MYYVVLSVMVCSCVVCDGLFSYNIFWLNLQAGLNKIL